MRTSHLSIKRMIADEKSKLTDEQIFASSRYAAYLTDIAEGITKRYRRKYNYIGMNLHTLMLRLLITERLP